MDILYLVDRLENLIASSRRMPLVNQIILKETDILPIIEQMRTSIPDEVKQARRIIQEKERILAQAQADASSLLSRAREESDRAINREGLLRAAEERSQKMLWQAEEQAHTIIRRAEEHSEHLKSDADAYVMETLRNLREHLTGVETGISRTILSIERGLESIEQQEVGEDGNDAEEDAEYGDPDEEEAPQRPQQTLPRRASLAVDTMGGPTFS
ncbi:MAG: hypothetical protein JO215_14310 [Ktedonobacteraceae bacterium]|nr:hypothetical protein [Ktedonobacteraceae bacterium]MBV9615215.1 hypothetical protein [Ktedonobacteraceae bacterium]